MSSDKVLDTLHRFITRDLVLIISGGTVVGTFLYLSGHLPAADDSWMLFALLAGLGYFIAYSIQEVLCILGLITTTAVSNPNRFVQWLYKRYDHRAWKPITFDSREARHQFTDDEQWAEFQRIVTLQMVGTAGGPSMVACGFMFMLKWWNYPRPISPHCLSRWRSARRNAYMPKLVERCAARPVRSDIWQAQARAGSDTVLNCKPVHYEICVKRLS